MPVDNSFGFSISATGGITADAQYPVYKILQQGTATLGGWVNTSVVQIPVSVPVSAMPIFAVKLPVLASGNPVVCMYSMQGDDTTLTRVDLHGIWKSLAAPESYQVPWVLAAPVWHDPPAKSAYGLEVYDGSGRMTFSSDANYLKIKAVSQSIIGATISHPAVAGDRYVAINSMIGYKWLNEGSEYGVVYIGGMKNISSTSIGLDWNLYWSGNPFANSGERTNTATVMVCEL